MQKASKYKVKKGAWEVNLGVSWEGENFLFQGRGYGFRAPILTPAGTSSAESTFYILLLCNSTFSYKDFVCIHFLGYFCDSHKHYWPLIGQQAEHLVHAQLLPLRGRVGRGWWLCILLQFVQYNGTVVSQNQYFILYTLLVFFFFGRFFQYL